MLKTLVVFVDNAAQAIAVRRAELGLPPVAVSELSYGIDEVMQLVNILDAKLLTGKQATLADLLDTLAEGFDVVWLITHGEPEGWYLNDGLVNASETTAMMRSSGATLTVMNTCSSYEVAWEIANELGTALICTLSEVPDRTAFITGVILAQKLAAGLDYETAYELAKPGQNSIYELIRARRPIMSPSERDRPNPQGMPDTETLLRFMRSVSDLDMIVNGEPRLGLPALKDTTRALQTDIAALKQSVTKIDRLSEEITGIKQSIIKIEQRQVGRNRLIFTMAAVIGLLILTVGFMAMQGIGA